MASKKTIKQPILKNYDEMFDKFSSGNDIAITIVDIDILVHFRKHLFKLYTGERMDDLVESIKVNGVLVPIIVRKIKGGHLEILAGHNRTEGSKLAKKTTIPAIILENISDEEAMAIVVETNLIQRSFSDMLHSEKAAVIASHHSKMFLQGKRNDITEQVALLFGETAVTSSQVGTKLRTDEKVGEAYSLSRNTIARYLRIHQLNTPLKIMLDDGKISFIPAVEVSFLPLEEQKLLAEQLDNGFTLDMKKARFLRECSNGSQLDRDSMILILSGKAFQQPDKPRKVNISNALYSQYFSSEQSAKEVDAIVEEALKLYFDR